MVNWRYHELIINSWSCKLSGGRSVSLYTCMKTPGRSPESDEEPNSRELFDSAVEPVAVGRKRRDALTDAGLAHFHAAYPGENIAKEDVFYYVYGLLHSPDYRERYADNLSKELPRIPCVKKAADFLGFLQGRA